MLPRVDRREIAAIFAGGALGTLARGALAEAFPHPATAWPWGACRNRGRSPRARLCRADGQPCGASSGWIRRLAASFQRLQERAVRPVNTRPRALPRCVAPGTPWGVNVVEDRAWIIVHEPGDTAAAVAAARALIERERSS